MSGDRITITRGAWRHSWGLGPLPVGAEALGSVRVESPRLREGALLRMATGVYVLGAAGVVSGLPQRAVRAALGRKRERLPEGRPVSVGADAQVLVRGPHELLEAVAERSTAEGITTSEGWRRAARDWLGRAT